MGRTHDDVRKKLIEVALPLECNQHIASGRKKSPFDMDIRTLYIFGGRVGHWRRREPSSSRRWWMIPQAIQIFSGDHREGAGERGCQRLSQASSRTLVEMGKHSLMKRYLRRARAELAEVGGRRAPITLTHPRAKRAIFDRQKLPSFHDPFAGGGALPLEAQRLGLESYASDLNPVAVLINKAMIEIPPKFAGHPPVNPESRRQKAQIATASLEWGSGIGGGCALLR